METRVARRLLYLWPADTPLTVRAALPDVSRLVAREWSPLIAAVAAAAAFGWWAWGSLLVLGALGTLVAIEETAHLVAASRLAPDARLGLRVRRPLRLEAWVQGRLGRSERAIVALAGPLAAGSVGLLTLTLPLALLSSLRSQSGGPYSACVLPCLPVAYLIVAALPFRDSDAAVVYATWRCPGRSAPCGLRPGALVVRTIGLLLSSRSGGQVAPRASKGRRRTWV